MAAKCTTALTIAIYAQASTTYKRTTRGTAPKSQRISTKLGVRLQLQSQGTERRKYIQLPNIEI